MRKIEREICLWKIISSNSLFCLLACKLILLLLCLTTLSLIMFTSLFYFILTTAFSDCDWATKVWTKDNLKAYIFYKHVSFYTDYLCSSNTSNLDELSWVITDDIWIDLPNIKQITNHKFSLSSLYNLVYKHQH